VVAVHLGLGLAGLCWSAGGSAGPRGCTRADRRRMACALYPPARCCARLRPTSPRAERTSKGSTKRRCMRTAACRGSTCAWCAACSRRSATPWRAARCARRRRGKRDSQRRRHAIDR